MMKKTFLYLLVIGLAVTANAQQKAKNEINSVLDNWHKAAANADSKAYFGAMDEASVFIGTDPTENWDKQAFQKFAKSFFDKGKAWDFKPLQRNVYLSPDGKMAWFDELLDTWMKICRGSGVLEKTAKGWKIKQYVLSMTVPNDNSDEVIKIKTALENPMIEKLKK